MARRSGKSRGAREGGDRRDRRGGRAHLRYGRRQQHAGCGPRGGAAALTPNAALFPPVPDEERRRKPVLEYVKRLLPGIWLGVALGAKGFALIHGGDDWTLFYRP